MKVYSDRVKRNDIGGTIEGEDALIKKGKLIHTSKGIDRFKNCEWALSEHNLPIISGAAGILQCKTVQEIEAGDHTILIGEVVEIKNENKEPLLYHRRNTGEIPEDFYTNCK